MLDGRRGGYTLHEFTGNTRKYRLLPFDRMGINDAMRPDPSRAPLLFGNIPGLEGLSGSRGVDGVLGTGEMLELLDDSPLDPGEPVGIDPYNSGEFDRSRHWDTRFRN